MNNITPIYFFAFFITFVLTVIICSCLIPVLKKRAMQPIYDGGPSWHTAKSGTPTMGGISFIIAACISATICISFLYFNNRTEQALSVVLIVLFAVLNSLIGLTDDLTKLARKKNAGLSPLQKLAFQSVLCIGFIYARQVLFDDDTKIIIFGGSIELGIFYYLGAFVFLLGIINCANLTDGIDGLASSVSLAIGIVLFLISNALNVDSALISAILAACALGFLVFNLNPAKIFMGDTGSLFLGAIAAALAFTFDNPFLSFLYGGIYVIEGCSVILQVVSFKTRRKRIFIMSPIHHHLEKRGYSEMKICYIAMVLTLLLSIPVYFFV